MAGAAGVTISIWAMRWQHQQGVLISQSVQPDAPAQEGQNTSSVFTGHTLYSDLSGQTKIAWMFAEMNNKVLAGL